MDISRNSILQEFSYFDDKTQLFNNLCNQPNLQINLMHDNIFEDWLYIDSTGLKNGAAWVKRSQDGKQCGVCGS